MKVAYKIVSIITIVSLVACGSRSMRGAKNIVEDINTKGANAFSGYNPQDPASMELLRSIGGASLKLDPSIPSGSAVVAVVLKDSCEQFSQEIVLDGGAVDAVATNSKAQSKIVNHGSFESRCIGKNGSCDEVAILFSHNHDGKEAQAVITFTRNVYGKYSVVPAQNSGIVVTESDHFLSERNSECKVVPKDSIIYREQE